MEQQLKSDIIVSVMPTYRCYNGCDYCYLSNYDRSTSQPCIDFATKLRKNLKRIIQRYNIVSVELYGGDLSTIPAVTVNEIVSVCRSYCKNIHVTWNNVKQARKLGFTEEQINISVNPERRDFWNNLRKISVSPKLGIITVVTSNILNRSAEEILRWYNDSCGVVTFIPYSDKGTNKAEYVTNRDYSQFMIRILNYFYSNRRQYGFSITNSIMLKKCIGGTYSPAMKNNIFITPNGNFACVDFGDTGIEYFNEFCSLDDWERRCHKEDIDRVNYCGSCENYLCCMAEHFKTLDQDRSRFLGIEDTCNGYPLLVQWCKEHSEWI